MSFQRIYVFKNNRLVLYLLYIEGHEAWSCEGKMVEKQGKIWGYRMG